MFVRAFGFWIVFYRSLRDILIIFSKVLTILLRGPHRPREIMHHMYQIGWGSLPIIVLATAFAGVVVTSEIAFHMDLAMHTIEMIPGFSGQFVLREVGIAIPALLLVSKVGASTTAEVGTMKVTEQIDALKLLQIDPIEYLVFPRFLASIIVFPCLTVIAISVTLTCAILVASFSFHFSVLEYLNALAQFVSWKDLFCAIIKSMTFGSIIPIISCYFGFQCRAGAQGVGTATTNSVVTSTLVVIILDFLLSFAFSSFLA